MTRVRQAKDFLVGKIVEEARRQGGELSEKERRALYFSEADTDSEDGDAIIDERKIAKLIHNAHRRLSKEQGEELKTWSEAIRSLREGDHYLIAIVDQAVGTARPPADWLKLIVTAIAVCGATIGVIALAYRFGLDEDSLDGWAWAIATCAGVAYLLACALVGRGRMGELVRRLFKLMR